jgi:hypothetical protein
MLDIGDDLVGRQARADVGTEQLEIGALFEAHFELDATVNRCGVEHEEPRFRAFAKRQLHAAQLHVIGDRQPDLFEVFARSDGERHRLGESLPDGLQRVEVGIAPFLLAMRGERRGHAAAS